MSNYIPEEILIEILLKLPAKSLIRFCSVRKAWQSLIRSPFFESLFRSKTEKQFLVQGFNFSNTRHNYSLIAKGEPLSTIDFPFDCPIGTSCRIKGSCNGLLCLSIERIGNDNRPPVDVIIWNPCTRNSLFLPEPLGNPNEVEQVLLGFGVASNVYKVVRVGSRAEIFTLGTGTTWRKLSFSRTVRPNRDYCWFFRGFVHWIVIEFIDGDVHSNSILTFDVGNEVFGEIKLPEELNLQNVETLAIIGESFGLVEFRREEGRLRFDVWIMKDYDVRESWTKLYRIDGNGIKSIVGFLGSSELLIHKNDFGFVIYNAKTKEIKRVGNFGENGYLYWYMDEFKESLVLLGGSV